MDNDYDYGDVRERVLQDLYGKNWLATFCLLFLFGLWGAHRFYTGKTGSAIAMLICSLCIITLPVSAIWCVVDFFTLVFGQFKHADGDELYEPYYWLGYIYIAIFLFFFVISFLGHMIK